MNRKKILVLLFLFCMSGYAQVTFNPYTTRDEALIIATNILNKNGVVPSASYNIYPVPCGNHSALYEIVFESGQSVIVAGHKTGTPVLSIDYNTDGFSCIQHPEEYSNGYLCMLDNLYRNQVYSHGKNITDSLKNIWRQALSYPNVSSSNQSRLMIGPLLTTKWCQQSDSSCPFCNNDYNKYMPQNQDICSDTIHYHFPTGCSVTAIGQVMNYWKYPILRSNKLEQIDWCNMPERIMCGENATPAEKKEAVAHLMKMLGDELGVHYGGASRGSIKTVYEWLEGYRHAGDGGYGFLDPAVALPILQREFGYSLNARCICRWFENEWDQTIKDEITAGRPVIYWAFETDELASAHTFVCDGYDSNSDLFHFNWGHRKNTQGSWVSLSNIEEDSTTHWNFYQWAIVGFEPSSIEDFCDKTILLSSFYHEFYRNNEISQYPPYAITPGTMAHLYSADPRSPAVYRTIPTGATATYRAHEEVVLQDGFIVERGADFTAHIVPCPNCEESRNADITDEENGSLNETVVIQSRQESIPRETVSVRSEVYPNPTDGEVTVAVDGEVQSIVIYNTTGQPVGGWNIRAITPDHIDLGLSTLPDGHYLICVQTSSGIRTHRVAVAR